MSTRISSQHYFYTIIVSVLLLALFFQTRLLSQEFRFHGDEAFFMHFARNAAVNADWMLSGSLDKPPVSIYINATALMFFAVDADTEGVLYLDIYKGEFAGRVTGIFLALIMIAAMIALSMCLYRDKRTAYLTGLLLALSPFVISFAPTAFMDMAMLCFAMLSLLLISREKFALAGIFLALSIASKPQGIFFLPLWFVATFQDSDRQSIKYLLFGLFRAGVTLCIGIVLLLLWDAMRPETGIFALGASNNSPDSWLVAAENWLARIGLWWEYLREVMGGDVLTLAALCLISIVTLIQKRWLNRLLWVWCIAYVCGHVVLRFNIYDRYLLIPIPIVVLLLAHALAVYSYWLSMIKNVTQSRKAAKKSEDTSLTDMTLSGEVSTQYSDRQFSSASGYSCLRIKGTALFTYVAIIVGLLLPGAWRASGGNLPIGGDRGYYAGIDDLTAYLNEKPVATVIYDRWLGWQLDYYMGQWSDKRRVYYPDADSLVIGALALPETETRYFIAPVDADYAGWLSALEAAGFEVSLDRQFERFVVYALIPPGRHPQSL